MGMGSLLYARTAGAETLEYSESERYNSNADGVVQISAVAKCMARHRRDGVAHQDRSWATAGGAVTAVGLGVDIAMSPTTASVKTAASTYIQYNYVQYNTLPM